MLPSKIIEHALTNDIAPFNASFSFSRSEGIYCTLSSEFGKLACVHTFLGINAGDQLLTAGFQRIESFETKSNRTIRGTFSEIKPGLDAFFTPNTWKFVTDGY